MGAPLTARSAPNDYVLESVPQGARSRSKGVSRHKEERRCAWCSSAIPEQARADAVYCSSSCRQEAFRAQPCTYCGLPANSVDHVIPRAYLRAMQDIRPITTPLVPCCLECNSTAGANVFRTLSQKRKYIKQVYRRRYAKLLASPDWTDEELAELGPTLRSHVRNAQLAKITVRSRLYWPRLPEGGVA